MRFICEAILTDPCTTSIQDFGLGRDQALSAIQRCLGPRRNTCTVAYVDSSQGNGIKISVTIRGHVLSHQAMVFAAFTVRTRQRAHGMGIAAMTSGAAGGRPYRRDGGRQRQRRAGARAGQCRHRDGPRHRHRDAVGAHRARQGGLRGIARAPTLSQRVLANIRQNLLFAFVYKRAARAAGRRPALSVHQLAVVTIIANAAMSASSVSVIANALRRTAL